MVVVFDLDDTLFDESAYAHGGLRAAAQFLSPLLGKSPETIATGLIQELKEKRPQVFDRYLLKQGMTNAGLVKRCISIYRAHDPHISLYPEAIACLKRFRNHPLYVVTDGNKLVQQKKFHALGLETMIKKCLCTNAYGIAHCKPSPYCFQKICKLENVPPSQVVYIADDPHKDFVGIKPLGFHTIRVMTGRFRHVELDDKYEADIRIRNLNEIDELTLFHKRNFHE